MRMRERDNSTPRAQRASISAAPGDGAQRVASVDPFDGAGRGESGVSPSEDALEDTVVRSEQRSAHRSKRPPPLPNRKAHKIKRIKSQRSTPWAALDPQRSAGDVGTTANEARRLDDAEARAVGATTLVRRESQLIDAEREQAERRRRRTLKMGQIASSLDPGVQGAQAPTRARAPSEPDRRWLLLLRVGRDELAGIWDGRLASCEPSVWRPATKTWAPLFEVPQIATLVTATVKQRQAKTRASVPASPAPRRRQPSGVAPATRRSSVPPGPAGRSVLASLPDSEPQTHSPRTETLRPSSMAELGGQIHPLAPAARLALRSPYIPPPPRVPNLATAAARPLYADESSSGPLPSYAAEQLYRPSGAFDPAATSGPTAGSTSSARAFEAAQAAQAFEAAQGFEGSSSEGRVIPLTRRTGQNPQAQLQHLPAESSFTPADAVLDSLGAAAPADSYAPHAHTVTASQAPRAAGIGERAGWLFGGVAAALVLTTFTGVGSSLREGVAGWFDPKPRAVLSAEATETVVATQPIATEGAPSSSRSSDTKPDEDEPSTVSVDELPVLTKSGRVVPARGEAEAAPVVAREKEKDKDDEPVARSHARSSARALSAAQAEAAPAPAKPQPVRFDPAAARRALQSSVARAQSCTGEQANGTIVVTFAPAGGVASVSLANLTGNDVRKGCVLNAFRGARITPFQGDPVTVQKSFQLR